MEKFLPKNLTKMKLYKVMIKYINIKKMIISWLILFAFDI